MYWIIKILSLISAVLLIANISSFELGLGNSYYTVLAGVLAVLLMLVLLPQQRLRFNPVVILLLFAAIVSITLNDVPDFFKPEERIIAFVLVISLVGPLIRNNLFLLFRKRLFQYLSCLIVIMVTLSFGGIVLGAPNMTGKGGYAGLFNHSMMFGPMAALAMLINLYWLYNTNYKNKKIFFYIILSFCFMACVAAGSRSALLGGILGLLFFLYKINQGQSVKYLRVVITVIALVVFSFPLWESYTKRIIEKMKYAEEEGSLTATRELLWNTRLEEFNSSPIYGIGFAAIDPTLATHGFDEESGQIEPGSSWLVVLSMTGLMGFLPLSFLITRNLIFVYKTRDSDASIALMGAILVFFLLHMMAEGYIFSAGSGLFFWFWLLLGTIEVLKTEIYEETSLILTKINK